MREAQIDELQHRFNAGTLTPLETYGMLMMLREQQRVIADQARQLAQSTRLREIWIETYKEAGPEFDRLISQPQPDAAQVVAEAGVRG